MSNTKWKCLKCANEHHTIDKFRATGGRFAKVFDVQNRKFTTLTCTRCTFTEIYKTDTSSIGNVFDFFTN